jgi:hypothetical protein
VRASRPSPPPKPPGLFVAHALALTLLIGFWPTPRGAYPAVFHVHANALLGFLEAPHVRLEVPAPESEVRTDTVMVGAPHAAADAAWHSWFSVRRIGYWPSAALLAMLLATPLSPLRRAIAILTGLALLDAFTLGRIGLEIAYASYELAQGPGSPAQGPFHLLLRVGSESLTATIPSVAFVFVCWVVVASPWRSIDLTAARTLLGISARTGHPRR